ncbi:MAG: hypothetical protein ABSF69_09595 [Polyangiaceae bacterium]
MTDEEAPRILERDIDHVVAAWRRVAIVVWCGETRLQAIDRLGRALLALQDATGHSAGLFTVVGESTPLPSGEARALSAAWLRKLPLAFSVVAFEGAGFRAAAVRAVVSGVSLAAKLTYPRKSFACIQDAAAWVGESTSKEGEASVPAEALIVAVHAVRAAQQARAG